MQINNSVPVWCRTKDGVAFSNISVQLGGRMPDFCIIGSAKSGTSALNEMLAAQPFIYMNPLKEPNYFSTPVMLERGDDWYRGLYARASKSQRVGEASTSYTRYPAVTGTVERMALANPNMKLIYLVRNPVARTESDCMQILKYAKHVVDEDHTNMPLDEFFHQIENPDHIYYSAVVSTSMYIDQIMPFIKQFGATNVLILFQNDIKRNPKQVLTRICNLLDVDPSNLVDADTRSNVTSEWQLGLSRTRAATKFQKFPFYGALKSVLPPGMKSYLLRHTSEDIKMRFTDELRDELGEKFREPNRRLAELIGDLPSDWLQ
jgi:hypothetical protein